MVAKPDNTLEDVARAVHEEDVSGPMQKKIELED